MNTIFKTTRENQIFVFIDGSYFSFYRYFSIMSWWKNAFPNEPLDDPNKNELFVEKYKSTFIETLNQMSKKLNISKTDNPIFIVGKDCKRENIWRNELCKNNDLFKGEYKGNRKNNVENGFMGGPFIQMGYQDDLFYKGGIKSILSHPSLEADDCIAISVKFVLENLPKSHIYIITSDKDYLQLAEPRVEIYNLNYKKLTDQKSSTGNATCDLFCKIIMGDPSDNIASVLKKCGPKKAMKCYNDSKYFEELLKKEDAYAMYELNKKLVDFNEIPKVLKNEFLSSICISEE